jgi:hypothetical protein
MCQGFFLVAEGGLFHDPIWLTAQRKSPVSLLRWLPEFFIFHPFVRKLHLRLGL